MPEPWPAPVAPEGVTGTVDIPGSKSLTNRALVLAALAEGPSTISHPLHARDTVLMVDGLRALGVDIAGSRTAWHVSPPHRRDPARPLAAGPTPPRRPAFRGNVVIDTGLAGTVMRFLPVLAALADGPVTFDGDLRARERPMAVTITSLRSLGVRVDDGDRGTLPFTVRPTGEVPGGSVELDSSASSQFLSGLLLAAPAFVEGLTVRHVGAPLPSRDHIAMTVAMLRDRGVTVEDGTADRWRVAPGPLSARDVTVEPDLSTAAPFLAAALVAGGSIRVPRWPGRTTQPGGAVLDLLARMGARVDRGDGAVTDVAPGTGAVTDVVPGIGVVTDVVPGTGAVTVSGDGHIDGIDVDLGDQPELVPVVAALAALADSPSRITGVAHVRGQESDRLAALATEINALGGDVEELPDGLVVRPRALVANPHRPFHTYADHRIAHAGALLGLVVPGLRIADIATTAKTFPDFATRWAALPARAAP